MKKFICGVLAGAILSTGVVFATQYNIYPNPYNVLVDGEKVNIEGYNVDDYSYFKLRDIGKATGFDVQFLADTILIETKVDHGTDITNPTNGELPSSKMSVDNIECQLLDDGKYYIPEVFILTKYSYEGRITINKGIMQMVWGGEVLLDNIPHYQNKYLIDLDYYNEVMLPVILSRLYEE